MHFAFCGIIKSTENKIEVENDWPDLFFTWVKGAV
jgi:hypothetical protein